MLHLLWIVILKATSASILFARFQSKHNGLNLLYSARKLYTPNISAVKSCSTVPSAAIKRTSQLLAWKFLLPYCLFLLTFSRKFLFHLTFLHKMRSQSHCLLIDFRWQDTVLNWYRATKRSQRNVNESSIWCAYEMCGLDSIQLLLVFELVRIPDSILSVSSTFTLNCCDYCEQFFFES